MSYLERLRRLGFDLSTRRRDSWHVRCSQCQAIVINDVPTHERGCPNVVKENA